MKNIYPTNGEEINLIKFVARFQYIYIGDVKEFFKSNAYYRKRITRLVKDNILRRQKRYLILGKNGIEYMKITNNPYYETDYSEERSQRLKMLSHIGAIFYNSNITFTPSFEIKNKQVFTETSRKYLGNIIIDNKKYLLYKIPPSVTVKNLSTILSDIKKEREYDKFIILVNSHEDIILDDFTFGKKETIILNDTEESINNIQYLNKINIPRIIKKMYGEKVYLSNYDFCEYTNSKNLFVVTFPYIDTEKINRLKIFLDTNQDKNIEIVCNLRIKEELKKYVGRAIIRSIDFTPYIDKEIRIYE